MLAAFHFHRDEFPLQRDHKVNFLGALVIPPEIGLKTGSDKLRIYVVFCHAAFEIRKLFLHEEDVFGPDIFLGGK